VRVTGADALVDNAPPELRLLIACARVRLEPETGARITALASENLHWDYVWQLAQRHGMAPLLYWHLKATCPELVPPARLTLLHEKFDQNHNRNLFLTGELFRLIAQFESSGIPVVAFKGPVLAYSVYKNLALRYFKDLDLLVRRKDALPAQAQLVRWGYRPQLKLTPAQQKHFVQAECELRFFGEEGKSIVELHWDLEPRYFSFPLDVERLWDRLETLELSGHRVHTFSPDDLLLILCEHGARHLWARLEWLCSVAEMVRAEKRIDWERVMEQARALGSERMVMLGLYLSHHLLDAPLPAPMLKQLDADSVLPVLARRAAQRLLEKTERANFFDEAFFHLRARERWRDRATYCIRLPATLTHGDWESAALPSLLFPLYFFIRPFRLARKYGAAALKRFR
jgi:hypothetical protein